MSELRPAGNKNPGTWSVSAPCVRGLAGLGQVLKDSTSDVGLPLEWCRVPRLTGDSQEVHAGEAANVGT